MSKMYRVEIIANQSVEEEITELLNEKVENIQYTLLPDVHGKGLSSQKLGSTTWPEQNFLLFSYVNHEDALKIKGVIEMVLERFPSEGISFFAVEAAEL